MTSTIMTTLSSCFRLNEKVGFNRAALREHYLSYDEGHAILSTLPSETWLQEIEIWHHRKTCAQAFRQNAPLTLLKSLEELRSNEISALLIRGFPTDYKLPPTPTKNGFTNITSVSEPLKFLLGIFESMGVFPVGYAGENENRFIRHVVPSECALSEVSSHGSREPLNPHIDNGHLPIGNESCESDCPAPNYIIWFGLRTCF